MFFVGKTDKTPQKRVGKTDKRYKFMLNRHIDSVIEGHYKNTNKALLLTGARQTGKTYAIRSYAKKAGLQLVEMNFLLQLEV